MITYPRRDAPFGASRFAVSLFYLQGLSLMFRYSLAFLFVLSSVLLTGCGSDEAGTKFDKDELAKYAEENPLPYYDGTGDAGDD